MPVPDNALTEDELFQNELTTDEQMFLIFEPRYTGCIACWIANFSELYLSFQGRDEEDDCFEAFLDGVISFTCEHEPYNANASTIAYTLV